VPSGQWTWHEPKAIMDVKMRDVDRAKTYIEFIFQTGWPSFLMLHCLINKHDRLWMA